MSLRCKTTKFPMMLTATTVCFVAVMSSRAQTRQSSEYWMDSTTGLTWAVKDNGKDISWRAAVNYCRKSNLAGFSDWRMANMNELQGLYDKNVVAPGMAGDKEHYRPFTWHIKGSLYLTGDQWTTLQRLDDRGKPSGYVYYFDFNEGRSDNDPTGWPYPYVGRRVLCVHGPQAFPPLVKP
jgi:Protein of unknown function (DUF1566)